MHYIFTIKSISQSQPKAGYIIIYTLTLYHNNQSYNLPTVDYRQELSGYIIFIYGYCPEIKVEVGNMHCRLNHTLSSAYSVRGGYKWVYTISIPISNHNQLCYINCKKIFKGQKIKCQRLPEDDIRLFSRILQALIFPALHYAEKK